MGRVVRFKIWPNNTRYEVGDNGVVYSLDHQRTGKRKTICQEKDRRGYPYVQLYSHCNKKQVYVHRMVALLFIENPENKATVNHKNGIKTDNNYKNLEWATNQENVAHAWRVLGRKHSQKQIDLYRNLYSGEGNQNTKLKYKDVDEMRRLRKSGMQIIDLAKRYSMSRSQVSNICNNHSWVKR